MITFFSGGGPLRTDNPEKILPAPNLMLSYVVNTDDHGRPDNRFKALLQARQWEIRNIKSEHDMKLFFSGQSYDMTLPERILKDTNDKQGPCVMLTHHELHEKSGGTVDRFYRLKEYKDNVGKVKKPKERCYLHFLDSGAHSIYMREAVRGRDEMLFNDKQLELLKGYSSTVRSALKRENPLLFKASQENKYAYYRTDAFWDQVDAYAKFVKENIVACDYYANLDAIYNPDISWQVQQYLEDYHKLSPVPVIHHGTPLKWVKFYIDQGHDLIGLGGIGQETEIREYYQWANDVYNLICPPPRRIPIVRTHGFAMTGWDLLRKYPWWSVDSASWVKMGGYGLVAVPHKRKGKFVFDEKPYNISMSTEASQRTGKTAKRQKGKHLLTVSAEETKILCEWLEMLNVPLGSINKKGECEEWGVLSHHGARKIANLWFFKFLEESMPEWPWRYEPARVRTTFNI